MTDVDLTAFGLEEPRDHAGEQDAEEAADEPAKRWPECVDCGRMGREVQPRLNQRVTLCPSCFADREGVR